jgi:thiol-disulfide isomerase/thioredoxin
MRLLLKITLLALLIEALTIPLRAGPFMLCAVVTFTLFFIFMQLVLKKYSGKQKAEYLLISTLIGCSLIQLPFRIMDFDSTLISLPDFLFHLLGIILGYLFYKSSRLWRAFILIFSLASCIFIYFKGGELWRNKLNFGTFTGKIEPVPVIDFKFQTEAGDTLSLSCFKGRYLLLDCWFTRCGYCYEAMPEVQKLYDAYKNNDHVAIYAMHSRRSRDSENSGTGAAILKKNNYDFPCLSIDIEDDILRELGVNAYPTVLIFDEEGRLVFRGGIKGAGDYMDKLAALHAELSTPLSGILRLPAEPLRLLTHPFRLHAETFRIHAESFFIHAETFFIDAETFCIDAETFRKKAETHIFNA